MEIISGTISPVVGTSPVPAAARSLWSKAIPRTNLVFLVISVLLVFGLDLAILFSSMDLLPFWIEMIVVFGVFLFFYYLENHVFKKRFSESHSQFDGWILALIVVRNIVFLLNFIPFIQILGGLILISVIYIPIGVLGGNFGVALLGLAVPAHLILYVTLLVKRHKNSLP